jgi:hypothetical protein
MGAGVGVAGVVGVVDVGVVGVVDVGGGVVGGAVAAPASTKP